MREPYAPMPIILISLLAVFFFRRSLILRKTEAIAEVKESVAYVDANAVLATVCLMAIVQAESNIDVINIVAVIHPVRSMN